ncbi:MAG: hypothetical protein NZ929_06465 [Aigarchaeota archaeon]|nr:hypothetical protein [Aigarchaeota archaeon]MCX8192418.1 hypothetical protein [Nitrososphaeria archaeon]MDW7986624.1 hypothetical protein [Nitrososphaerota archaeon]
MLIDSKKKIYVLDASAIIFGFSSLEESQITCREVLNEVKYGGAAPYRATVIREGAGPRVIDPSEEYIEMVKKKMDEIGEQDLSEADVKLLALAIEFKEKGWRPVIVSADYSIQNIALAFDIDVEKIIHRGISKKIRWISYCPSCRWVGGVFRGGTCPRCGNRLKRRSSA